MVNILFVGQRFYYEGYIGTIRYLGSVDETQGDWVGVEWDDHSRGRHNGSKNGKVYFKCPDSSGSFLRPAKINLGITLWDALVDKYLDADAKDEMSVYSSGASKMTMETVGMQKVQQQFKKINQLTFLGLRDHNISRLGLKGQLATNCSDKLEHLDLSKNLISSWVDVAEIASELTSLKILNLSNNILMIPENINVLMPNFSSLGTLILNCAKLTWVDVIKCLSMWPNIEELNLEQNEITNITKPEKGQFCNLRFLNISNNNVQHWKSIANLQKLDSLETLLISNCGLSESSIENDSFKYLAKLSLSGNKFNSLYVFNELNKLAGLKEVIFKNNPLSTQYDEMSLRGHVIAKIESLQILNRTLVTEAERQGAELDYMRAFGAEWRTSGGHQDKELNKPSETFCKDHPRFMEFVEKYDAPSDNDLFKKSTSLASNLVYAHIIVPSRPDIPKLTKKLPTSITVGRLQMLIRRLMKVSFDEYMLTFSSQHNTMHIIPMDNNSDTLHSLSFESGDTIEVVYPHEVERRVYAFERISTDINATGDR